MCNLLSVPSRSAPPKSGIFFSYIEKMNYNKIHNLCICSLQMVYCLTSPFFFSFSKEESSKGKWAANKDWTVITEISDLALKFQEMFYRKEGKIKIHVITCRIIKLNTSNALYYTPKFLLFYRLIAIELNHMKFIENKSYSYSIKDLNILLGFSHLHVLRSQK